MYLCHLTLAIVCTLEGSSFHIATYKQIHASCESVQKHSSHYLQQLHEWMQHPPSPWLMGGRLLASGVEHITPAVVSKAGVSVYWKKQE